MENKKMTLIRIFLTLAFVFAPMFCVRTAYAAGTAEQTRQTSGWQTDGDGTCYLDNNGEKATGWKKISEKYYYFDKDGFLLKNQIVGSGSDGYWYADQSGIRVTEPEIRYAVQFVMKHSKSGQSAKARLKSCYKALCKYKYQRIYPNSPSAKKIKSYAKYMFRNRKGNCYRYASAFAYIARVLGYDSRVGVGRVSISGRTPVAEHGWCEVKIGGVWKMCDCSIQRGVKDNLFLQTRKNYPYRFVCKGVFTMKVKNGKITWK